MKILFLLPPSEWKNNWWNSEKESLSFNFEKPYKIVENATEKDLKCKWERFKEWILLNKTVQKWLFKKSINRYSWVMYNAINYKEMSNLWKKYFEENFLILSGFYWITKPLDLIWNYKLPIETKWLYDFWSTKVLEKIIEEKPKYLVNLLPISYAKLIWIWNKWKKHLEKLDLISEAWIKIININFLKGDWKLVSHWVKKIKWKWIKNITEKISCHSRLDSKYIFELFWWKVSENWDIVEVNIII